MALFAFEFNEVLTYVVRGGAAVIGFLLGWFLTGPLANLLSRLAFHRPVSPGLLPWVRMAGAVGIAVLFFFIAPVGFGPGSGPGPGGGPGEGKEKGKEAGPDKGGVKERGSDSGDGKEKVKGEKEKATKDKKAEPSDNLIQVEILGGDRYPGGERWYLFQGEGEPLTGKELKDRISAHLVDKKLKRARVQLVLTNDSLATWRSRLQPEIDSIANDLFLDLAPPVLPKKE
jgi:hypothetical protein